MKILQNIIVFLFIIPVLLYAEDAQHLVTKPKGGDGAYSILNRYHLSRSKCNLDYFQNINNLGSDLKIISGKTYKLPILVYHYNGTSIRSTIGNNNMDLAKKIQAYNEKLHNSGLRKDDYRKDNILWVPYEYLHCESEKAVVEKQKEVYSIFGKKYENVEVKDKKLEGCVYYIIAGHGGPDPGAQGTYNGKTLCEDEYAYDISLRLARNLLEHSVTVQIIIRDPNDGIRDGQILAPDKDEVCRVNQTIPLNQIKRLNQRSYAVNNLYKEYNRKGVKKQRVIVL
ncbi:MAG: N-acetylmuramoyl-L-alanine amidase, partial [Bacteroidales bacterium]|nr:N-acetylmuramoyl-L-alanine amidase [Bacteroidales bacterium]